MSRLIISIITADHIHECSHEQIPICMAFPLLMWESLKAYGTWVYDKEEYSTIVSSAAIITVKYLKTFGLCW